MSVPTVLNAVIGYPLAHTRSPLLHDTAYRLLGIPAVMLPFENPDVAKLVSAARALPIGLLAVTMPFKKSVMPLLDRVDRSAKAVGAVNTVVNRRGILTGYNTDIDGIRYALRSRSLKGKSVLLVGAGGAAQAIAHVVSEQGGNLLFFNRTPGKALALKKLFGGRVVTERDLSAADIDVIVNATPLGMHPRENGMSVPTRLLARRQTVFDLVYNPLETKLLRHARRAGARCISGIDLFVVQGLRQVELWSGRKVVTPPRVAHLKRPLISAQKTA